MTARGSDVHLARLAEESGFVRVHVESAPNPNAPTALEAVDAALSETEQARFLDAPDRAFTDGHVVDRTAAAYVSATKGR